jgi:hypothetical protein
MSDVNPYSPPSSSLEIKPEPPVRVHVGRGEPVGLGGWLALMCFGLMVSPIRLGLFLFQTYVPIYKNGTWHSLLDSASDSYHPALAALLMAELVVNFIFIVLSIWLLTLFFRKSRRFPRHAIALYAASAIFIFADSAVLSSMGFDVSLDPDNIRETVRAIIGASVWIPYMLVSKRVKNTFVEA